MAALQRELAGGEELERQGGGGGGGARARVLGERAAWGDGQSLYSWAETRGVGAVGRVRDARSGPFITSCAAECFSGPRREMGLDLICVYPELEPI